MRRLDELNRMLLITGISSSILCSLVFRMPGFARTFFSILAAASLIFAVIRLLGGNPARREQENIRFLGWWTKVRSWWISFRDGSRQGRSAVSGLLEKIKQKFRQWKEDLEDHRHYRYMKCPNCGKELRVPRGKGKIRVTCKQCGEKFETKS